ncbi:Kinesin-like protein kif7 [Pleodorina starrii]|uniref:Kinesin-like protein kif7 n=1 Tax=Pleodorina starrii TaxID=330485 RepID=A0A9W6BVL2_9CHLO|nr:Kinesin-like protein kif7 [Pleodorina starrii]
MALPAPHYLGLRSGEEALGAESPGSDGSDMMPRRLRYSEVVLPLEFLRDDAESSAPAAPSAAAKEHRPLKVFARIKPAALNNPACGHQSASAATAPGEGAAGPSQSSLLQTTASDVTLRMRDGGATTFAFDSVFEGSEQQDFFSTAIEPLLDDMVSLRKASSVFMSYGASGTGKSYTMGGTAAQPGMIPLTLQRLFQVLRDSGLEHQVQLSFYEVYGNKVTDLLRPLNAATAGAGAAAGGRGGGGKPPQQQQQQQPALNIVRVGAGFCLPGLLQYHALNADDGLAQYTSAARLRKKEATKVNSESSRSHAVFTVQVLEVEGGVAKGRSATLSLVDLAGVERVAQTQHAGNKLRESAGINSSLSVLRRCLEVLRHNQASAQRVAAAAAAVAAGGAGPAPGGPRMLVPPVRESGLTTLFSGVLSGRGNLALSVHLSPHPDDYPMTLETLKFGALAAKLTVNAAAPEAPLPPPPPQVHAEAHAPGGRGGAGPSRAGPSGRRLAAAGVVGLQESIPEEGDAEAAAMQEEEEEEEEARKAEAEEEAQEQDEAAEQYDRQVEPYNAQEELMADAAVDEVEAAGHPEGAPAVGAATTAAAAEAAAPDAVKAAAAVAADSAPGASSGSDYARGCGGTERHRVEAGAEAAAAETAGGAEAAGVSGLEPQQQQQHMREEGCAGRQAAAPACWDLGQERTASPVPCQPSLELQLADCRRELQLERAAKQELEQQLQAALASLRDLQQRLEQVQADQQQQLLQSAETQAGQEGQRQQREPQHQEREPQQQREPHQEREPGEAAQADGVGTVSVAAIGPVGLDNPGAAPAPPREGAPGAVAAPTVGGRSPTEDAGAARGREPAAGSGPVEAMEVDRTARDGERCGGEGDRAKAAALAAAAVARDASGSRAPADPRVARCGAQQGDTAVRRAGRAGGSSGGGGRRRKVAGAAAAAATAAGERPPSGEPPGALAQAQPAAGGGRSAGTSRRAARAQKARQCEGEGEGPPRKRRRGAEDEDEDDEGGGGAGQPPREVQQAEAVGVQKGEGELRGSGRGPTPVAGRTRRQRRVGGQ